ncbi:hypothetical protein HMPREF0322_01505 [Desulfitobacterium hafniense DP7]|uniref:Uncharacterized protein n=1 Tax=Desulfitobacterium hafniense DP7 TaxID=537010 RepID=G9XKM2_DESHA|nr:hypothetical protein HMPREF0322_01505 [Desulfitobacterium hafniense DP7]
MMKGGTFTISINSVLTTESSAHAENSPEDLQHSAGSFDPIEAAGCLVFTIDFNY